MNQQDIKPTDFIIQSDNNIPVYNSLLSGYMPGSKKDTDFTKQFQLPKLELVKHRVDIPIHLPDFTYYKPETHSVNIFTNHKLLRYSNAKNTTKRTLEQNNTTEPHVFSALKAQTVKTDNTTSFEQQLRPVPLIELNKKQQSYTKEINPIIGYNPVSVGSIEAGNIMIGIVIGIILFFMYIRMAFGKQVNLFFGIVFNHLRADNIQRNSGLVTKRASFLINILFFITVGLLLQHQLDFMGLSMTSYSQLQSFIILSLSVTTFYGLKWVFGGILAHILKIQDLNKAYFFHIFIYNKLFALLSFPIILALPYISSSWISVILSGILYFAMILYMLRIFRILRLSIQRKLSVFYLFLYLCALEITPMWVMVITVQNWLNIAAL